MTFYDFSMEFQIQFLVKLDPLKITQFLQFDANFEIPLLKSNI